jgi:hypothetical protein
MEDPDLCRSISGRGHQLIRDNFTWAINAERHVDLYRRLLESARNSYHAQDN